MIGFGTEKIEEDISGFLPEVKVQRMDLDTTRSKSSYQKIISDFESGHTQVLVGTQMVTKGLDFDNVSLVGVLNADKMMHYPDYRSMERSYQLMMQVAGRAGRKGKQGKVIIQTFTPDHWMFELLRNGDYMAMYNHEIRERQIHGYPPFIRMIKVLVKHKQDDVVDAAAHLLSKKLKEIVGERLLGPERPYIPRINNYYLRQFIIKLDKTPELPNIKAQILNEIRSLAQDPKFKSVRTSIDVDPL
jgi:primosomal protein N' (replication factor Y) (superfamily II helicase)